VGPDKKVGIFLQKPKTPQKFKAWDCPKSDQSSQYQIPIEVSSVMLSSALPVRQKRKTACILYKYVFVQVAKLWGTTSLQIIADMRENGQRILRAQSFQTLRGNEWLDSDVSDRGEKLFVSIPSIVVIQR